MSEIEYITRFREGFPPASSGVLINENKTLITGHVNGIVVKWNIDTGEDEIIFKSDTIVQTISNFKDVKIAIGYHSGGLYVYHLKNKKVITIQEPTYKKVNRVWKTIWVDENNLIMTSTYGEVRLIRFTTNERWEEYNLRWHSNAIFAISKYNVKVLTGDWSGNIIVWDIIDGSYQNTEKIRVFGTLQGLYWHSEKCISAINKSGKLYLIEKTGKEDSWQISTEIDIAKGRGNCVILAHDGDIIYAGTNSEIIQFDISTNQIRIMNLSNVKELFIDDDNIYALTSQALIRFDKEKTEIPEDLINYRFKKVSLLGHTGTGKSTFCNLLITGKIEEISSTYGKRVWPLALPKDDMYDKKIIFHDHGGQETVLDTFLPFLNDSDIFLIFYSQIDKITFNRAYELLMEIRKNVGEDVDIYLVQTFIDHELDEVPYAIINELKENSLISDVIELSPYKNLNIDRFYDVVINDINWDESKIMISSPFIEGINITINHLREKNIQTSTFDDFKDIYQIVINNTIANRHLKFLLIDATNEGKIEYYPDILDVIIINDEKFNKMRSEIPIFVDHNYGIINMNEMYKKYANIEYLQILDEIYLNSNLSFKFNDLRVFTHKLKLKNSNIPEYYKNNLSKVEEILLQIEYKEINISPLLEQLSDMRLQCIDVSKSDGLFTWSDNAYIYYILQEKGTEISGKTLYFAYYVSGNKEDIVERLKSSFKDIINKLYGPIIDKKTPIKIPKDIKKK